MVHPRQLFYSQQEESSCPLPTLCLEPGAAPGPTTFLSCNKDPCPGEASHPQGSKDRPSQFEGRRSRQAFTECLQRAPGEGLTHRHPQASRRKGQSHRSPGVKGPSSLRGGKGRAVQDPPWRRRAPFQVLLRRGFPPTGEAGQGFSTTGHPPRSPRHTPPQGEGPSGKLLCPRRAQNWAHGPQRTRTGPRLLTHQGPGCGLEKAAAATLLLPGPRSTESSLPRTRGHPAALLGRLTPESQSRHLFFFFFFFFIFGPHPPPMEVTTLGGRIRFTAAALHHSHSHVGSELHLRPTPQLTAIPDPYPTERGQGSNLRPRGS